MEDFLTDLETNVTTVVGYVATAMGAGLALFAIIWGGRKVMGALRGVAK